MGRIFIYYNNLKFAENQQFTLEFSNGDLLQGIIFFKNRDYFLMIMSCFMEVENDITKLKQYPAIEKISELANRILKMELIMDMIHQKLKCLTVEKHMKWVF